jgi:recombination protein RecT
MNQVQNLKLTLAKASVQEQFKNALAHNAPLFIASLIDIYGGDTNLQKCQPSAVIMEALKAATLRLPINRSLGFAYIVPYGSKPEFQIGYKGYIQLAMRTGAYRYINADVVYGGEFVRYDKLTGELDISGSKTSSDVVGYFAFMETVNGFRKTIWWPYNQMKDHAKRYSKSYTHGSSPWQTEFDKMALKTMLRALLGKFGVMSIDMVKAFEVDSADTQIEQKVDEPVIDMPANVDDLNEQLAQSPAGEPSAPPPSSGTEAPAQDANPPDPATDIENEARADFNTKWPQRSNPAWQYACDELEMRPAKNGAMYPPRDIKKINQWNAAFDEFEANA